MVIIIIIIIIDSPKFVMETDRLLITGGVASPSLIMEMEELKQEVSTVSVPSWVTISTHSKLKC